MVTPGYALVSTQHHAHNKQTDSNITKLNPLQKSFFFTNNQEEHCKSYKRSNFTSTTNENQTTNKKTFSIPSTTKNRIVKQPKRPFFSIKNQIKTQTLLQPPQTPNGNQMIKKSICIP